MGRIQLHGITRSFAGTEVIHGVDLAVEDGELVVFVGPSGCGKSTLLRLIAGLDRPTTGRVEIDGRDVTRVSAADRGLAMVFQSYALYPHMTVRQNLSFGLENTRMPKAEIAARVDEAARMLEIGELLSRRPTQLSGGQRQRVAIGRAIVREPLAFLLDEPLSNLDAELRVSMRAELAALHDRLGTTMIYVTHDQVEAMTLADRIVVLRAGRVEQVDTPLGLFNRPGNLFVAGFIGAPNMNLFRTRAEGGVAELPGGLKVDARGAGEVTVGIRPQHLHLADGGEAALEGTVRLVEALGTETVVHAAAADGTALVTVLPGQAAVRPGETIRLAPDRAALHLFDADGRRME
ncbi:ABC transporter ATP-binding protein [Wenxinia marina]|uniref:Carbohydrate ABC transporter ATP-binding protein, CUT1 family n=1 Tax=Wenxinia marina DSM 24838 TaxID=1123501 RepID=A0A0D0PEF0_9RHOB|nr:sn-glycerol-3-phosphate ABC transporter ATP-binding protein UgpC [Wenxinia marina]KIQ69776.1 carbohydrate ABC transporter ATP-binding protein, CUT1 family [Wenxinia marina DSM 24838]GGL61092.1 sn-glycerol-3-phosphate import ATP-binding protein UgpC [Wenxinia marina]